MLGGNFKKTIPPPQGIEECFFSQPYASHKKEEKQLDTSYPHCF